ncbi:nucleotidyltransferase family protein [Marivita sp. S0852]|uniref:nucleotidyltransferase family protein n=1 Tax=Marivita sp. S0852 TaxID=3373893 RepID=UPI0039829277
MPDAVMLFAAGFGTRMGRLTADQPKPLIKVAGQPLIDHAMKWVNDFDPRTVVVNAHYKSDQIIHHFAQSPVQVRVEFPDILDTGGGLKAALPMLDAETVFTLNSDAVWQGPNPLKLLQDAWTDDMQALLLCVPKAQVIGHIGTGDFDMSSDGHAVWGTTMIYSGAQILRTDLVSDKDKTVFSLKEIWDDLVGQNALHAISYPGQWCDVGHPEGIALAEDMLRTSHV